MAHVKRAGIEIEGAFKKRFDDLEIIHDGSLCKPPPPELLKWKPRGHLGEVITGEGGIALEDVEPWMRAHYPDTANDKCGLHVHMSFGNENLECFARCSHPKFYASFLKKMEAWGKRMKLSDAGQEGQFWERLYGKNEYCKKAFIPNVQIKRTNKQVGHATPQLPVKQGGDRYCHLFFGLGIHGTIEARLLPTFKDVNVSVSGVKEILEIFDSWVRKPLPTEVAKLIITVKESRPRKRVEPVQHGASPEDLERERLAKAFAKAMNMHFGPYPTHFTG